MHFEQQLHTAGGTCRNAKNFPIFEEETALFQHAIKLLFDEGDPHFFTPLLLLYAAVLPLNGGWSCIFYQDSTSTL